MSFVLNEQSVFCPQLGSASCFLGMEWPEVRWGWEHPLLALLPMVSFQRTWKPELRFSLGEFVGTAVLEASGIRKGGIWRRETCHLGKNGEPVLPDSCREHALEPASCFFPSEASLPSLLLRLSPSQWLRKENSGTGLHFILE